MRVGLHRRGVTPTPLVQSLESRRHLAADPDDQISEVGSGSSHQLNVGGSIDSSISDAADVDLYRVTAAANQRLAFDVDGKTTGLDTYLTLFDKIGKKLAGVNNAAAPGESSGLDPYLAYGFTTAGTYYVAVSSNANTNFSATTGSGDTGGKTSGNYHLTATDVAPLPATSVSGSGLLTITGTLRDEKFSLSLSGSNVVLTATDGTTHSFSGVKSINVQMSSGNDSVSVASSITKPMTISGGDGNDTIHGGSGNDSLDGGTGNDDVRGEAGNDTVSGSDGNDTLDGGDGTDVLFGGIGTDVTDWSDRTAAVTVQISDTLKSGGTAGGLTDSVHTDIEIVWGSAYNDLIVGSSKADTLDGNSGNDTIRAGAGNDVVDGGAGDDKLYGESGSDTLRGSDGNDLLDDDALATATVPAYGNDSLDGAAGDDTLVAELGNDTMSGGAGNDTYAFDRLYAAITTPGADTIRESTGGGTDTLVMTESGYFLGGGTVTYAALVHLDQPTSLVSQANTRTIKTDSGSGGVPEIVFGTANNDTMYGSANADTLYGVSGEDELHGNAGNDVLYSYALVDGNTNDAFGDTLTGDAGNDSIYGNNGDDSIDGGDGDDSLVGNDSAGDETNTSSDTINGDDGDDFIALSGGTGTGGAGDDVFVNQNATPDFIDGGDGFDISEGDGANDFQINSEFEFDVVGNSTGAVNQPAIASSDRSPNATAAVTAAIDTDKKILRINGTSGSDNITVTQVGTTLTVQSSGVTIGTFSTNNLTTNGSRPAIIIQGGAGNDHISLQSGSGLHPVSLLTRLQGGDGNDSIMGGSGADIIEGDAGNDTVNGGAGNDVLTGDYLALFGEAIPAAAHSSDGRDVIIGGAGDSDVVTYTYRTSAVTINLGGGNSGASGENDAISGVEIAAGGQANDTLNGSSGTDALFGGPGSDSLIGGAGSDRLTGESGKNVLNPDNGSDFIDSTNSSGDTVVGSYTGITANKYGNAIGTVTNSHGSILFGTFRNDYFSVTKNHYKS